MTARFLRPALAALLLAPAVALGQPTGPPYRIDDVHADIRGRFTGGAGGVWQTDYRVDTGPPGNYAGSYTVQDARLVANASAIAARPAGDFGFVGVGAGQSFWWLQQTQVNGQLYLGVSGTPNGSPPAGSNWDNWDPDGAGPLVAARWIAFTVQAVRHTATSGSPGTGRFSVWQDGDDPGVPDVYVATPADGNWSAAPRRTFYTPSGSHVHYNWGFSEAGLYEVDVLVSSRYGGGLTSISDADPALAGDQPFTYTFEVQPVPEPAGLLAAAAAAGWAIRRWRR